MGTKKGGINYDHKTNLKLYRDFNKNSKKVKDMIEASDTIMYFKKYNTVSFMRHEGELGEVQNVDNMDMRTVAKNLDKRYDEV